MTVPQQRAQIALLGRGYPDRRKAILGQQHQQQSRISPIMLLFACFCLADLLGWFVCSVYGCNQCYDMGNGYYVMREGAIEDATNKQPCPGCGLFLYLVKRGSTMADAVWLCSNEECPANSRKA
jgi:hypothetical protein